MKQGQSYMKKGDYADAQSSFTRATKQSPQDLVAYQRLGMAALYNRDYKAAFAAFRKASAMHPRNTAMLYYAAGAGLYAGDYATARKYVDRLLAIKPNYAAAYHVRLLIDANLLDKKAQLKDARAVARLQPKDPNAYNDLGLALANNTRPKAAYAAFSRAIKMQPGNWQYYKNRAITDGLLKNIPAEIKDAKRSLALATDPVVKKQLRDMLSHAQKAAKAQH
jgi:tetratricopeptide (TPR) repeat protein